MHVDASAWAPATAQTAALGDELLAQAAAAARSLPADVDDAIIAFADRPHPSGALLLRNIALPQLPPTPEAPDAPYVKDLTTELTLLTIARRLGQPVGYAPEHGGRLVQNIVPTRAGADLQLSTSSRSTLMFHTETAFHPHRPRYLLLLCLRGDAAAHTTIASIFDLLERLDDDTIEVLRRPRFRTAVDASFLGDRVSTLGPAHEVVSGTLDEPTFVFDADLTTGIDPEACAALERVNALIEQVRTSVVLEPGDLLVIDNNIVVHGRSSFTPRFDGTDRWLQRSFVVADLAPSAADRDGRVITTNFGLERPAPAVRSSN
jgi:alpha-ketoglutarate-dependent taurine dioxygenase